MEILLNVLIFGGVFLRLLAAPSNLFSSPPSLPFVLILPKPLYPLLSLSLQTYYLHTHTHTRIYTPLLTLLFLVSDPPALLGLPHPVQGGAGANKAMKE